MGVMTECLEADTLVALGEALDWTTEEGLEHLLTCDVCRDQLRSLARLHGVLSEEIAPAEGFTDQVVGGLRLAQAISPVQRGRRLIGILNAALAGITAFFVVALAVSSASGMTMGPSVALVSAAAAAATLWWNRARRPALC
jgi:hypothetical protein